MGNLLTKQLYFIMVFGKIKIILEVGIFLKPYLKNEKVFNASFCVAYITLSYLLMLWHGFEFMIFDIEIPSAIRFLIVYIIFMLLIIWFLKISNSIIVSTIVSILSILYLKEYSMGPLQALVDSRSTYSLQRESIINLGFLVQVLIVIISMAIIFFAVLKLQDQLEDKRG